ncbi:MAG: MFS transporter [Propionibacteriaceae bacterium]|jgi:MFS family permease|nr:MFS transporter [Propionibacteriaceae bacterium]
MAEEKPRRSGLINVVFLGLVSFFTDLSTEMVYPLIPLYLMATLGATPALVGVIEGIAESAASLLKVFSGYISDRFQKKKGLAFTGYAAGVVYKLILLLASSWWGILGARVIDRIGKGIRTAPRDVLVAESVKGQSMGRAFGLHKALDMIGAALGILITFFILRQLSGTDTFNYKALFALSMIPGVLGLVMFVFIRQTKTPAPATREPFWANAKRLDRSLKTYLLVTFLFTLGNSSNAFLLIRAKSTGFSDTNVILLYFLFNLVASLLALPLGHLSDRIGRKNLLVPGYLTFSVVYLGFAFADQALWMVIAFGLYGVYTALIAGVERAYVAEIAPPDLKGTMLGLQSTVAGIALLPASLIAGLLWEAFGPRVPFLFGATMSLAAAAILLATMPSRNGNQVPEQ